MKQVALSCLAIDVGHFFHVRKHPHKSAFVPDVNLGVATFWQRASATSQTERGASGLDQHGRASTARNAPRGKLPAAVTRSEEHTSELQSPCNPLFPTRRSSDLAIDVGHFFHVRKHPHKSAFVPDVNLGVATFWQRASATSQTERGASGLDQHGRASTARNAPRGKLPAAVT